MTSNVVLCDVPNRSKLHHYVKRGDFVDCYSVVCDRPVREAAEIIIQYPGWVKALMLLRRVVTTPFGLVNDTGDQSAVTSIGFFPIESETDEENPGRV